MICVYGRVCRCAGLNGFEFRTGLKCRLCVWVGLTEVCKDAVKWTLLLCRWVDLSQRRIQMVQGAGKGFVCFHFVCLCKRQQCAAKRTHANASTSLVGSGAQIKLPGPPMGRLRAATLPWPQPNSNKFEFLIGCMLVVGGPDEGRC